MLKSTHVALRSSVMVSEIWSNVWTTRYPHLCARKSRQENNKKHEISNEKTRHNVALLSHDDEPEETDACPQTQWKQLASHVFLTKVQCLSTEVHLSNEGSHLDEFDSLQDTSQRELIRSRTAFEKCKQNLIRKVPRKGRTVDTGKNQAIPDPAGADAPASRTSISRSLDYNIQRLCPINRSSIARAQLRTLGSEGRMSRGEMREAWWIRGVSTGGRLTGLERVHPWRPSALEIKLTRRWDA